jgi:4-diphosphocytidyl-2-C-methyl-D-erythritol kinase
LSETLGAAAGLKSCANEDPRVPLDSSNTCYRMAERVLEELGAKGNVRIEIEKRLPVQGGLGAASSNAVAAMVGLERALKRRKDCLGCADCGLRPKLGRICRFFWWAERRSEWGAARRFIRCRFACHGDGVVTPEVGVSTPRAFADWDALVERLRGDGALGNFGKQSPATTRARAATPARQLTRPFASDRLFEVGCVLSAWLSGSANIIGYPNTGASAKGGSRAGKLLSDLVRTGIENDFERVVFPKYPELRDIKGALERAGSKYASLSGSGSSLYGLFRSPAEAAEAAGRLRKQGLKAVATSTLTRQQYWKRIPR